MQAALEKYRVRRDRGDEGGFTLIELLIVIVILGILAAIVVFAVQNLTSSSAKASCQSDYKTVETAVEAYNAQTGVYPGGAATAFAKTGEVTTAVGTTADSAAATGIAALMNVQTLADGTQVGPWLKDAPSNGNNYSIWVSDDGLGSIEASATTAAPAGFPPAKQIQSSTGCPVSS